MDMVEQEPKLDLDQVKQWLEMLHGDSTGLIHVCATGNWSGQACNTIDEAVNCVRLWDLNAQGIYVRVTTVKEPPSAGSRGSESDTACLPALWADIDIAGSGHKTDKPLPNNEEKAVRIITESGLPKPTLWVHSGGGLYPYWFLSEPHCPEDLDRIKILSRSWHKIIQHSAEQLGWFYGTEVADLSRVLRIPGTVNRKIPDHPRMCQLVTDEGSGTHFTIEELYEIEAELIAKLPQPEPKVLQTARLVREPQEGLTPGDAIESEPWDSQLLLGGFEWQVHHQSGDITYWTRPGKSTREGWSATTGRDAQRDRLYVFSSSTLFEPHVPHNKFAVYSILHHGGDYSAAASELRRLGYGDPLPEPTQPEVPDEFITEGRVIEGEDDEDRPKLMFKNSQAAAEWLLVEIGKGKLSGMFLRNEDIVHTPRVGDTGYVPLTKNQQNDDGPAQVRRVHAEYLAARIQFSYHCYRQNEKSLNGTMFPVPAARAVVNAWDMLPNLLPMNGVTHSPMIRSNGTLIQDPGYDNDTGFLYLPEGNLKVPPVAEKPTPADVAQASSLITEMLSGFPFVSEHDRANYIGILLTPLLRTITPPPYKLGAIEAHQPGSGKTLLANLVRYIHGGVFRVEVPPESEELRKQITSILSMTTGPVVLLDNVTGHLKSPVLVGLLTSDKWDDRRLGSNNWERCKNDRVWLITGNNLSIGGDLPRRTVKISIDPGMPNPELRTNFPIRDLESWVKERRGHLLWALLTMVRYWVVSGGPMPKMTTSDGYAKWSQVLNGILTCVGIEGTFDDPSLRIEVGTEDDEWRIFLEHIYRVFKNRAWTVKELLEKIDTSAGIAVGDWAALRPIPVDCLPGELAERILRSSSSNPAVISKSLGMWLKHRVGRWSGTLAVRRAGHDRNDIAYWRVVSLDDKPVLDSKEQVPDPFAAGVFHPTERT